MDNLPTFSNPSEVLNNAMNSFKVNRGELILQFELEQAKEHRQTVELALEILNKCWGRMVPGHNEEEAVAAYDNALVNLLKSLPVPAAQEAIEKVMVKRSE